MKARSGDGSFAVVRTLASHRCGPYLLPGPGAPFKKVWQSLRPESHILTSNVKKREAYSGTLNSPICSFADGLIVNLFQNC